VSLYEVPGSLFREAGVLPGRTLRSLDAVHLATAIRIGVDLVVTYDVRMAESARALGLPVSAPS
jgi:predicted nucleic acid-binding protein